jgi:hypothetical protein
MNELGENIGGIIFIALIAWGGYGLYNHFWGDKDVYNQTDSSYSTPYSNSRTCIEPENPYSYNSGHYVGYEWGENGKTCGGNSRSFIEGCEEYESQEESYQMCLSS